MYKFAFRHSDEVIFYFDFQGNKYVARGGNLSWRINNPGLVHCHNGCTRSNGSIGACGSFAIFPSVQQGRKALVDWLHCKKYQNATLLALAKQYRPDNPLSCFNQLITHCRIAPKTKLKSLTKHQLNLLIDKIEKLSGYAITGTESFSLLPKITAKIENGKNLEDSYLVEGGITLSKKEAIDWVLTHRLDAVIVHEKGGLIHLSSRPKHSFGAIREQENVLSLLDGKIETAVRTVGKYKSGQCVWGFINGISNSKKRARLAAGKISAHAGGERVFSLPNDRIFWGLSDITSPFLLKSGADTPVVHLAVKFLRYLLTSADQDPNSPAVIVFAHSQGAIICEHAIEFLEEIERQRIRIFTLGGASLIAPGKSHPDSHNYASATDWISSLMSPNLQHLALQRYYGYKNGLNLEQVIDNLALQDAMQLLDSLDPEVREVYVLQRKLHYKNEFTRIHNLTILDPDPESRWEHVLDSPCYQMQIQQIIKSYQKELSKTK